MKENKQEKAKVMAVAVQKPEQSDSAKFPY